MKRVAVRNDSMTILFQKLSHAHGAGEGVLAFCSGPKEAYNLRVVDKSFKGAVASFPWSLVLDDTDFTDAIQHWPVAFPNLKTLSISCIGFDGLSDQNIYQFMASFPRLQALGISELIQGNFLTPACVSDCIQRFGMDCIGHDLVLLGEVHEDMFPLIGSKVIEVNECDELTDDRLRFFKGVKELRIIDCVNVTQAGIRAFVESH
jgi:hypothetical protein